MSHAVILISVLALLLGITSIDCAATRAKLNVTVPQGVFYSPALPQDLPNVTWSGYLPLANGTHDAIFYSYYTAQQPAAVNRKGSGPPIVVWLQGGPGCSSQFGNFYELGPYLVNKSLQLAPNPGAWNRKYDLLFIDQPVGTGFSIAGEKGIPTDELEIAADIYVSLQLFFSKHKELQERPLFITGESYGGKYVPAIGHFILEMERAAGDPRGIGQALQHVRELPKRATDLGPPRFRLTGLAVGDGLTDPATQVLQHADTAFYMGMIDMNQRIQVSVMQLRAAQLIFEERWEEAHAQREELMGSIIRWSGVGTLEDFRRYRDYDADKLVDQYLNQPAVKRVLGVPQHVKFESCSETVGNALGPDVMKSVKPLIPDILQSVPVLLYQGQMDAQDGVASNEPWIYGLDWHGKDGFQAANRQIWKLSKAHVESHDACLRIDLLASDSQSLDIAQWQGAGRHMLMEESAKWSASGSRAAEEEVGAACSGACEGSAGAGKGEQVVVGYWKQHSLLTHVVLRNAGHMVPHYQPKVAQAMIEKWIDGVLKQT
ncbi:hypothetical protein CVIRNUC_007135 [Coccomyxa viridis]|uniref:Carboxypeptidase n=1 Tax=Coccomyxa viridis TaxID=1274662 RepID=A0AAV1IA07_9CHLO|nr:hypothetical protein CVIRNUC_007135 [Coccomyxa viridis]